MSGLVDHSPHQPVPRAPLENASNVVLIDNYDSFTWNVYQYLVLEGARITVYRNDEITLQDLIAKRPTQLVISPGPGHPDADAGISNDAIRYFAGKVPVLGVCMGEQCMYSVFGGRVDVTGEILHGKTSLLAHDGKGVFENIQQNIPVTRYHSLAGTHTTLPECLEVSARTTSSDKSHDIIMGIRHKTYTVEGVQFHPESILSAEGRPMLWNFLQLKGGTWLENERLQKQAKSRPSKPVVNGSSTDKTTSILQKIYDHRREAVALQKSIPSQTPGDLQAAYDLGLAPAQIDFKARLEQTPFALALMAEIKRASPSKGIIALSTCAPAQARKYALAGASVISVLTEPEWFKGSIDDLRAVRQAVDGMSQRPAILRKEFVFDEYQILEARLAGADTVLLIVKMLDQALLERLYRYSQSLGMEPLVEVNNVEEMEIAVKLGSKVIGVNNRNLTSFEVDMGTTSRLMSMVPQGTILCALSGISGPEDVQPYIENGVGAVLVGEALMRASDTQQFVQQLLTRKQEIETSSHQDPIVKICGTRSAAAALAAIEAGADAIGIILVPSRRRFVQPATALEISKTVHATPRPARNESQRFLPPTDTASSFFDHSASVLRHPYRAVLVGVFLNQSLDYVLEQQRLLDLDVVQLHGSEPIEWANLIPVPVIHAFKPGERGIGARGYHAVAMLDSGAGGTGELVDSSAIESMFVKDNDLRVMLAGGLTPENVETVLRTTYRKYIVGVDTSSGVEENGIQSIERIKAFVSRAKGAR